jgi:hypothetical protein
MDNKYYYNMHRQLKPIATHATNIFSIFSKDTFFFLHFTGPSLTAYKGGKCLATYCGSTMHMTASFDPLSLSLL